MALDSGFTLWLLREASGNGFMQWLLKVALCSAFTVSLTRRLHTFAIQKGFGK